MSAEEGAGAPDSEEKSEGQSGQEGEVSKPSDQQDATEVILRKVAAILAERSVNYAVIVNDGASPRWIVSDVYWAIGVFNLISRRIEAGWDEDFFAAQEEEDDEED